MHIDDGMNQGQRMTSQVVQDFTWASTPPWLSFQSSQGPLQLILMHS